MDPPPTEYSDRHALPVKRSRLAAIAAVGIGVFFAALLAGLADMTYTGSPAGRLLLRGFIFLMFGGIAAGATAWGISEWRGRNDTTPAGVPPPALLALCPGCGSTVTDRVLCHHCWHPLTDCASLWKMEDASPWGSAFLVALFGAVLCLGLGIAIGPYLEGERRIWANVAFGALGLVIAAVGLLGVYGGISVLWDSITERRIWKYDWAFRNAHAEGQASASAVTKRGRLVSASGSAKVLASEPSDPATAEPRDTQRPFARALFVLHGIGLAALWFESQVLWKLQPPDFLRADAASPTISREESYELMIRLGDTSQGMNVPSEVRRLLAMLNAKVASPLPIGELWQAVADDAEALALLEHFAPPADAQPEGVERLLLHRLGRSLAN